MQHSSPRQQRLLSDIHRMLSALILRDVSDPRLAGLTITRVEASGKQMVNVWFYHADIEDGEERIQALRKMVPHFEHELRRALPRRRIPKLRFFWDTAFEKSGEVLMMLRDLDRSA